MGRVPVLAEAPQTHGGTEQLIHPRHTTRTLQRRQQTGTIETRGSRVWSRRITDEHRMVYRVVDDALELAQLRFHY